MKTSFSILTALVGVSVLGSLLGCEAVVEETGYESTGGHDYTYSEATLDADEISQNLGATYDANSNNIVFTANFSRPGYSNQGVSDGSVELVNGVTVDSQEMDLHQYTQYVADDSREDIVSCGYDLNLANPPDLNEVFTFEWTSRRGEHFANTIQIPSAVSFAYLPNSISLGARSLVVSYMGAPLQTGETVSLVFDRYSCLGSAGSMEFQNGTQSIVLDTSHCTNPDTLDLHLVKSRVLPALDVSSAGGQMESTYVSTSVRVDVR